MIDKIVRPKRKPSGKARYIHYGHKYSKRFLVTEVNSTQQHFSAVHCQCGGGGYYILHAYRRNQIFDITAQAYSVDEHQSYRGTCEQCGDKHQAGLPQSLASGRTGPNVLAFVAVQFHHSISEIQQQLEQNFGLRFSRGVTSEAQGKVNTMLTPAYHAIKQQLLTAPIVHADETSHTRSNENRWLW
ncbi:MAG: transposase [Paraglaciecola sp.]|jgi:transposase